jgi:hypothetical protein
VTEVLTPSGLLVPTQDAIVYPGNDAWLELEARVADPGADPAWAMVETVPDAVGIPAKTVTAQGANPPSTQNATSVFGGSSLLFPNANGTALQTPDHADWNLGAGDFTIEGRYYMTVVRKALFAQMTTAAIDCAWELTMDAMAVATPGLTFYYSYVGGPGGATGGFDVQIDRPFTATLNQWYHIAVVRTGGVLKMFVDGSQIGADDTSLGSRALRDSAAPLTIGGDNRSSGGNDFRGYADEIRISKGAARWTANFTPPAAAYTRDANTALLMHCDGPNGGTAYTDSSGVPGAPFDPGTDPAWLEVER